MGMLKEGVTNGDILKAIFDLSPFSVRAQEYIYVENMRIDEEFFNKPYKITITERK